MRALRSLAALAVSVIGVHLFYAAIVRPHAAQALQAANQLGLSAARTLSVIFKDYEQEICLMLMCWGIYLIAEKCFMIVRHRYLFSLNLLDSGAPRDSDLSPRKQMRAALHELERIADPRIRNAALIKTLSSAARRYVATGDAQNTSDAIQTGVDSLAARLESGNSMIRYLIWAIPSIGFIGTVRGIGQALSQADAALGGDIASMVDSLGVAFNSTLVALIISIILMFLLHELQRLQDKLVVDTQAYCEEFLLKRIEQP